MKTGREIMKKLLFTLIALALALLPLPAEENEKDHDFFRNTREEWESRLEDYDDHLKWMTRDMEEEAGESGEILRQLMTLTEKQKSLAAEILEAAEERDEAAVRDLEMRIWQIDNERHLLETRRERVHQMEKLNELLTENESEDLKELAGEMKEILDGLVETEQEMLTLRKKVFQLREQKSRLDKKIRLFMLEEERKKLEAELE